MGKELQPRKSLSLTSWVDALRGEPQVSNMFIGRWSLYKSIRPMNYIDFAEITQAFHKFSEQAFGTPCDIQIISYKSAPMVTSFYDPDGLNNRLDEANEPLVLSSIPSLLEYFGNPDAPKRITSNKLTGGKEIGRVRPPMEVLWDDAGYVKIIISPLDKDKAPRFAFGSLTFKGAEPRYASFYVQPYDNPDSAQKVCTNMRKWGTGLKYYEGIVEHANNISADLAESWMRTGVRPW